MGGLTGLSLWPMGKRALPSGWQLAVPSPPNTPQMYPPSRTSQCCHMVRGSWHSIFSRGGAGLLGLGWPG